MWRGEDGGALRFFFCEQKGVKQTTAVPKFLGVLLLRGPGPATWYLCGMRGPECIPSCRVCRRAQVPMVCPPTKGGDSTVSSTSRQEKQQNMVAEVSAQLSLLFPSPVFPANLPACPGAVGRAPSPCAWGRLGLCWGAGAAGAACRCGAHSCFSQPPTAAALRRR